MRRWQDVVYAAEVNDDDGICPGCGGQYDECPCPGPTMDDYEYRTRGGKLQARPAERRVKPHGKSTT